jgi:hypothetical protein
MNNGWIKIHRKMMEHWIYQNSHYFHWWTDLLMNANFEDKKILIKGNLYDCKRGQSLYSLDTWAKRWKVDKSKVRRFLQLLQNDGMIVIENVSVSTRLTICKYECYQDERNADETEVKRKRNADETQVTPTKELKKDKKEKKEEENIYRAFDHLEISRPEFAKLVAEGWSPTQVDNILDRIENYKKNKDYKNLYRTALNWLAKEPKKGTIPTQKTYMVFYKKQNDAGKFVNMEISVTDEGLQELKNSGVEIYRIVEPEIKNLGGVVL